MRLILAYIPRGVNSALSHEIYRMKRVYISHKDSQNHGNERQSPSQCKFHFMYYKFANHVTQRRYTGIYEQ